MEANKRVSFSRDRQKYVPSMHAKDPLDGSPHKFLGGFSYGYM